MDSAKVGIVKEVTPDERRVALVPDDVPRLTGAGLQVLVETGAGQSAWFPDSAYTAAGAAIVTHDELYARADIVVSVTRPTDVGALRPGQALIGMLHALVDVELVADLAAHGVTAISLDALPRTLTRAQAMDALSSQASVAGYKAALVAANAFGRFFPLLITAAGTAKPARVLVLGAGVAGLQAIGTARRLGAVVSAYDVRPEAKGEVESLGARFLELKAVAEARGAGGYARALTPEEQAAEQQELNAHIARHDVVITTAQVPGRRPPLLVTAEAVHGMAPGSVIVDMAASPLGGNVELSRPEQTVVVEPGVTVIGAGNLPAAMPTAASAAFSRNISALLAHLVRDGALALDLDDEITGAVVITHQGRIIPADVAQRVQAVGGEVP